jgi:16S rRNA (adenine1518-N6/adenine1519-N6)-dimethyltransferase
MSLEEAKSLLREHRIVPNKLLGQNFMVDASVYPKLSSYAMLNYEDVVLDAGAGFGFLTIFLSNKCKAVVAVEKDPQIAQVLREQVAELANVDVIEGDVLKTDVPAFNKTVSIPPYYMSSQLVIWLLDRGVECAVMIVQKEFAERLVAPVGSDQYGWLTVVTNQAAEAELLEVVPKWMFHPQPEVDSIILRMKPWAKPPFTVKDEELFRRLTKWLFTQRNKKLGNAVEPFLRSELKLDKAQAAQLAAMLPKKDKRARELAPKDFGAIVDALCK